MNASSPKRGKRSLRLGRSVARCGSPALEDRQPHVELRAGTFAHGEATVGVAGRAIVVTDIQAGEVGELRPARVDSRPAFSCLL
jgi:hypothetical protein